jgi:bis(5'-nucleosyl)-tetraphosphatase (symmetrical)
MSTYVIGDIQGCFKPFMTLLDAVKFRPHEDELWLVGDVVNRGPDSLSVLRFLCNLPKPPLVVLGNHDLHLLAVHSGQRPLSQQDTLQAVLEAPDSALLCDWLRACPLLHVDKDRGYVLVHAGLPPQWTVAQAQQYAAEVEAVLASDSRTDFFAEMYAQTHACWSEELTGYARLRFIVNALTRIRFCTLGGELDFVATGPVGSQGEDLYPWFAIPDRASESEKILFGHWAALRGKVDLPNLFALDTGCVWGHSLTAMRLEDHAFFSVSCDIVET